MKPCKVLCCLLLLAILGVKPAQNPVVMKVVMCAHRTNQQKRFDYVIHA